MILVIVVSLLLVCYVGLAANTRRLAIEHAPRPDAPALDNPPVDPTTLTGQAYFDWEHSIPNPYEEIKHFPSQGCIRCNPPARGAKGGAITNTPATPLYRQGGADLSADLCISVPPGPTHADYVAQMRAEEWQRKEEAEAKRQRARSARILTREEIEHLTPEMLADMPVADYTANRAALINAMKHNPEVDLFEVQQVPTYPADCFIPDCTMHDHDPYASVCSHEIAPNHLCTHRAGEYHT